VSRYVKAIEAQAGRLSLAEQHGRARALQEIAQGALEDAQHDALIRDWNRASPGRGTVAELRADLASQDLGMRMRAAAALQQRGELDDGVADEVVNAFNAEVQTAAAAIGDQDAYPAELRPVVEAQRAALRAQQVPADPVDHATRVWNDFVRAQRPPTLAEQLEALGVQAEPEPQPVSSTQEA